MGRFGDMLEQYGKKITTSMMHRMDKLAYAKTVLVRPLGLLIGTVVLYSLDWKLSLDCDVDHWKQLTMMVGASFILLMGLIQFFALFIDSGKKHIFFWKLAAIVAFLEVVIAGVASAVLFIGVFSSHWSTNPEDRGQNGITYCTPGIVYEAVIGALFFAIEFVIILVEMYDVLPSMDGGQADPTSESEKLNEVKATRKAREGKKKDN